MDPISQVDRLTILLRARLLEQSRARARPGRRTAPQPETPDAVRALAALDGVDERQLRRAFVQSLLREQFGTEVINSAQFQQVVGRVTDAIEDDPAISRLLARLIGELKRG